MNNYTIVEHPYTPKEIRSSMKEDGLISGVVKVKLRDIINNDFEGFLDILSENLIGNPCLMGVDYKIVGYEDDSLLHIKVTGMVELED